MSQLLAAFWRHAEKHYVLPDGRQSHELDSYRVVIRAVRALYASSLVTGFGPRALKTVRETFDHQNLNELGIDGLSENPTIENMLAWVHDNLPGKLHSLLDRIECKEGRNSMFVMLAQSRPSRHGT